MKILLDFQKAEIIQFIFSDCRVMALEVTNENDQIKYTTKKINHIEVAFSTHGVRIIGQTS